MARQTQIKTEAEIAAMRISGRMLATVLNYLTGKLEEGITTLDLNNLAVVELKKLGGQPAFLGYNGFPAVICVSVNDELVHGIPGPKTLKTGDVVGLDFGVLYKGMITDGAVTVGVGKISSEASRLLSATKEALDAGIERVRDGVRVGDVSRAIESRLRKDKLGVVEDLMGHGVGYELHEEPGIPNYFAGFGPTLRSGMTIAIEPMASLGGKAVVTDADNWTIRSADGSLAAQFEHTVLVTETGAEVLTSL